MLGQRSGWPRCIRVLKAKSASHVDVVFPSQIARGAEPGDGANKRVTSNPRDWLGIKQLEICELLPRRV